jgi:hypothetical protein
MIDDVGYLASSQTEKDGKSFTNYKYLAPDDDCVIALADDEPEVEATEESAAEPETKADPEPVVAISKNGVNALTSASASSLLGKLREYRRK